MSSGPCSGICASGVFDRRFLRFKYTSLTNEMMFYLAPIFILLLLLLLTIFVLFYSSGLFVGVTVERRSPPVLANEVTLAYKIHTGSFNEAGYLFTEAYALNSKCIQCGVRSIGEVPVSRF